MVGTKPCTYAKKAVAAICGKMEFCKAGNPTQQGFSIYEYMNNEKFILIHTSERKTLTLTN